MKRIVIASFLTVLMTGVFAQSKNNLDPSYSTRNYKHANKAAFASRNNLEKAVVFKPVLVKSNLEYKHQFNQSHMIVKSAVNTRKPVNYRGGYKHPLGL